MMKIAAFATGLVTAVTGVQAAETTVTPNLARADGIAGNPVPAPRLKLADVVHHALMVHAGGDNHCDHPAVCVACGVIGG